MVHAEIGGARECVRGEARKLSEAEDTTICTQINHCCNIWIVNLTLRHATLEEEKKTTCSPFLLQRSHFNFSG